MAVKRSCYICGEKYFLNRHHIVPRSKGGTNNLSNIIRLCPTCHSAVHHGMYSEEDLFRLKEIREIDNVKSPERKKQIFDLSLETIYATLNFGELTFEELHAIQAQRQFSPVDRLMK